jgi:uncharacterized protein (DUF983 family)
MPVDNHDQYRASPVWAGLRCRCPRCDEGRLFSSYLKVAPKCTHCGLDYSAVDSADGPAVFIMLIVGFIVTFAALIVEIKIQPPLWVHAVLWIPLILGLSLGLLQPFKGIFVAIQLRHDAREGEIHDGED